MTLSGTRLVAPTLIIDEVHERSIFVDVLLAALKLHHLRRNVDLRVVLINCESLSTFFLNGTGETAPILGLGGGTPHPIQKRCVEDLPEDFRQIRSVSDICSQLRYRDCTRPVPTFPLDQLAWLISDASSVWPLF